MEKRDYQRPTMKKYLNNIRTLAALLMAGAAFAACSNKDDSVEINPETDKTYTMATNAVAGDVGKLICTDGHIHAYGEDAECTAARVAMIAYVGGDTGDETYNHGLAIALEDVSTNMLSWDNSGTDNNGKTAAEWCDAWNTSEPVTDGAWMLPNDDQWQNMLESINYIYFFDVLNTNIVSAGGTPLQLDGDYWSSTENDENNEWAIGWTFNEDGETATPWSWYKTSAYHVRACLAF